ncbi:zn-finger domain-containing protein [Gigaspora margarita]|uniref:Zn-finger domain-containing protein n=1 Tax=Gigaspora margarita TaxID=4874 RepID=A0A8H3XI04_GIGMA|nr:zn-finger domain-containing protein [Gigaspora margarita]
MLKELREQAAIDELDQYLSRIPRFSGLKIFREGLKNIKQFTADKYRNIMKVFLFIVEGLIKKHHKASIETSVAKHYDSALEYGPINGFIAETYETLHKDYVKKPYRASNKHDATGQIIQVVSRNSTIKYLFNCKKSEPTIRQCHKKIAMNGLLGSFTLETADDFFASYKAKKGLAPEALLSFEHFFSSLNKFFDLFEDLTEDIVTGNTSIKWYSYTNMVENEDYIRASSEFYNKLVFSNISINMNPEESGDYNTDNGNCYCKVHMLVTITIENYLILFDLALVQWYDFHFKNNRHLYKYDCPLLELSGIFDFVPVESIIELMLA